MTTASAGHAPASGGGLGRLLFHHEIEHFPQGGQRWRYLGLAVLSTIVLYYVYYAPTGVATLLLEHYNMSFKFFVLVIVIANVLGAFGSLPASRADKVGRSNIVIYGLLVVGLLQTFAVPNAPDKWWLMVFLSLIGIAEGAVLVATPALVRDFSPQLGRAQAMGFWTIGPVAGSLAVSLIVSKTLGTSTDWQRQITISGLVALGMFVIALFFLKDLSKGLRDQLMVSARDQAVIEARARGVSDEELAAAEQKGWKQVLKPDLIGSAFGISIFLLIYYAAAGFFVVFWAATFVNKDNTPFSTGQANALNVWIWGFNIGFLVLTGYLSDKLRVRKPFMVLGAIVAGVGLARFLQFTTDPHTDYYTLATWISVMSVGLGIAYTPWMAAYTESIEAKNPALVATGLSLWGWILRIVVGISTLILPFVVTSTSTVVDNAGRLPQVLAYQSQYSVQLNLAQRDTALFNKLATYPTAAAALTGDPQGVQQALKLAGDTIAQVKPTDAALKTPIGLLTNLSTPQVKSALQYLQTYGVPLQEASAKSGKQWKHWLWVDFAGIVAFLPFIFLAKGRWSPRKAREDAEEHERAVAAAAAQDPLLADRAGVKT